MTDSEDLETDADEIAFWDSVLEGIDPDELPVGPSPKPTSYKEASDDDLPPVTIGVPWEIIGKNNPMSRRRKPPTEEELLNPTVSVPWEIIGDSNSMSRKRKPDSGKSEK